MTLLSGIFLMLVLYYLKVVHHCISILINKGKPVFSRCGAECIFVIGVCGTQIIIVQVPMNDHIVQLMCDFKYKFAGSAIKLYRHKKLGAAGRGQ